MLELVKLKNGIYCCTIIDLSDKYGWKFDDTKHDEGVEIFMDFIMDIL